MATSRYESNIFGGRGNSPQRRRVDNVVKKHRLFIMVFADIALVLAQAKGIAAASGTSATAFWMSAISALLVGIIAWAAITASGFRWLRILNGLLLAAFVAAYAVLITAFFLHAD